MGSRLPCTATCDSTQTLMYVIQLVVTVIVTTLDVAKEATIKARRLFNKLHPRLKIGRLCKVTPMCLCILLRA
jgi:hypothetical protein